MSAAQVRASRNGITSPLGKKTEWLERTRIEGEAKRLFVEKAAAVGKGQAEALRDVAYVVAFGPEQAARMYGDGVLKVARLIVGMTDKPSS